MPDGGGFEESVEGEKVETLRHSLSLAVKERRDFRQAGRCRHEIERGSLDGDT